MSGPGPAPAAGPPSGRVAGPADGPEGPGPRRPFPPSALLGAVLVTALVWGTGQAGPVFPGRRAAAVLQRSGDGDPYRSVPPGRSATRTRPLAPSPDTAPDRARDTAVDPARGRDAAGAGPTSFPQARTGQEAQGHVAPFRPGSLTLPDGTRATVRPVGVRMADASLEIPEDPHVVGWWSGGAMAGESSGSVVLAGHVDSRRYGLGTLSRLNGLRPGQVVTVGGEGQDLRYRVSSVRLVRQSELLGHHDVLGQDGAHRLVLLTCGGPFDRSLHRYRDNLVVLARPVAGTGGTDTGTREPAS